MVRGILKNVFVALTLEQIHKARWRASAIPEEVQIRVSDQAHTMLGHGFHVNEGSRGRNHPFQGKKNYQAHSNCCFLDATAGVGKDEYTDSCLLGDAEIETGSVERAASGIANVTGWTDP